MAHLRLPGGKQLELTTSGPTTIGHSNKASLRIDHPQVAELHCVIRALKGGGFGLKDLGSQHGTKVNGQEVHATRLYHQDVLQIGDAELVFDSPGDPRPTTPAPKEASKAAQSQAQAAKAKATASPAKRKSSQAAKDDPDLPLGQELGGYRLEDVLGHGGMGTVYRATQLSLHREVALKVLKSELCENPDFVQRFTDEARAAGRFNHPNVVQVFDVGEANGRHFYSMELLEGGSLEDKLRGQGKLDISEALAATLDAARGLEYARELGLVHRDIKPDNLMLTQQGTVKICDLGLAGDLGLMAEGKLLGTPHFLSPEQVRKDPADHRSDLYALGCTFYRLLTGKTPFSGKTVRDILRAQLENTPPLLRDVEPEAALFDPVMEQLLAKDPAERFQSASELAAALESYYESKKGISKALLITLVIAVLGCGAGLAYVLSKKQDSKVPVVKNEQKEKLAQQLAEQKAQIAYQSVKESLPALERASKLEEMAKQHPGTRFAKRAMREGKQLREQEQKRLAAEKAAEAARKQRYQEMVADAKSAFDAGKLAEAWARASKLAGEDAAGKQALALIHKELQERVAARGAKALLALDKAIAAEDFDGGRAAFLSALDFGGQTLPESIRKTIEEARQQGEGRLDQAMRLHKQQLQELRNKWLARRVQVLLAKDGAFAAIRAVDFAKAAQRLSGQEVPSDFAADWAALARMSEELKSISSGCADLWQAWTGLRFRVGSSEWRLDSMSWPNSAVLSSDSGSPNKISLRDQPQFLAALLVATPASATKAQKRVRAALLTQLALAHDLPAVHAWGGSGKAPKPSVFGQALGELSLEGLSEEQAGRCRGAADLARMLRAWQQQHMAAAAAAAKAIESNPAAAILHLVLEISSAPAQSRR
ncbi:MAG: hypothetical protein CSA62_14405 [Planctomycetota bacterium]|nr:MAG: hypothetical protein CSA62_14405 [Planctomycetota bacterium]